MLPSAGSNVPASHVHRTPPLPEEAAAQVVPPKPLETVHGLFDEQVTILEVSSLMSIVDSELIMVAEVAPEFM